MLFEDFWKMHDPSPEYQHMYNYCEKIWNALPEDKQQLIYDNVSYKKDNHLFVDYNPYYAIQKNGNPRRTRRQQMSYNEYYIKYGTTEEVDGWTRVFLPDKQTTIYVKS